MSFFDIAGLLLFFIPMDYEYSVIGSIFCKADSFEDVSEFTFKNYIFVIRKIAGHMSVRLHDPMNGKDGCASRNISEKDVTDVCKGLSERFSCVVTMRKGYEVYGNANVFNGGSDYEVIEEKWFSVEFDNGLQIH